MSKVFADDDKGLLSIKAAVAGTIVANKLLEKYGKLTPKIPFTVPHTLYYGPGGTGKTHRVKEAAKIMNCTYKNGKFISISPDNVKDINKFIDIIVQHLSWKGYLLSDGSICNTKEVPEGLYVVDPFSPKGPTENVALFIDEIHCLSKEVQEKLGLIILDFKYERIVEKKTKADGFFDNTITKTSVQETVFFPKFTLFAATTKPGDLIKPLRTRFANKISVPYYTDKEMREDVLESMIRVRGWSVEDKVKDILALISQGVARECENHLTGVFNFHKLMLTTGQSTEKRVITEDVIKFYIDTQGYQEDGLHKDQIAILKFLVKFKKQDGNPKAVGKSRICSHLGGDVERFEDELEPRLMDRGLITSGGQGREITALGLDYVKNLGS